MWQKLGLLRIIAIVGFTLTTYLLFVNYNPTPDPTRNPTPDPTRNPTPRPAPLDSRTASPIPSGVIAAKAAKLAEAWGFPPAKHFGQPFELPDRNKLEIPRFQYYKINSPETGNVTLHDECVCSPTAGDGNECGDFQELLSICKGLDKIRHRQQGNFTFGLILESLYLPWGLLTKVDNRRLYTIVNSLTPVPDQVYILNFKHIDSPELSANISRLRSDLGYAAFDYEYTPALLAADYHVSFPYIDIVNDSFDPTIKKKYLATFRGRCHHKERKALALTFANNTRPDVMVQWRQPKPDDDDDKDMLDCHHWPAITDKPTYWQMMQESKFCFAPGGDVHFTMRQVDVLACGCIPIYIADNMTLPFSDLIPWEKISLFLPENIIEKLDPKIILDYLEQFTDEEVLAIQKRLNHVYREFLLDMEGRSVGAMHSYWLQHQRVLERKNNKK